MSRPLTVKEAKLERQEAFRQLIKLYEMTYGYKKSDFTRKAARSYKPIMVTEKGKCYLCDETRALQKAHIIPVAIYSNAEIEGELHSKLREAMYLCATHHFCYDKYKLDDHETKIIKQSIKNYSKILEALLSGIEIVGSNKKKNIEEVNKVTDIAWRWWRAYCYGD